jgi:protease IV
MKSKILMILAIFAMFSLTTQAQEKTRPFMTYYEMSDFLQASPGAFKFGLYGYQNPAMSSYLHSGDMMLMFSNGKNDGLGQTTSTQNRWGIMTGGPGGGFGFLHTYNGYASITDWRYNVSFGNRDFSLGMGYGVTGGSKGHYGRSNTMHAGMLIRPNEYVSVGGSATFALDNGVQEYVADVAIRPLGNYPLTLYADMSYFNDYDKFDAMWSAGASWEFLPGMRVNGRYFEGEKFALGVDVSTGNAGIGYQSQMDKDGNAAYDSWYVRIGAKDRTVTPTMLPSMFVASFDMRGGMKYQRNLWFDNSRTLLGMINQIELAKNNHLIKGIVLNTSGMQINREMLWEIREKLREFKAEGKKVYIFIDRMNLSMYHFASVADVIAIDPLGTIMMDGYSIGKSYYKNMLAKLDIGFEELRYFKYKSAVETLARDGMSDADREQLQAIVDGWYEISKREITEERGMTAEEFDAIVNDAIMYRPSVAKEKNLVDKVMSWDDFTKEIQKEDERVVIPSNFLFEQPKPFDDHWSDQVKGVAVVYAVGVCAMDQGINARSLAKDFERAAKNPKIKAIVLRVDSPGGDAMASDYIARLIRKYKDDKPIIVSQGAVAASGGYWLSMDADKIFAAPNTITGSIGVISSWIYDKGAADALGISTDVVQKGKYASLGQSFKMPIIPVGLPVRNLNEDERSQMEASIKGMYDDFVTKVATGRNMDKEEIQKIAQGRVWTGEDGKSNGLIDKIGGLDAAIKLAKKEANITDDDEFQLYEYPKPKLFDLGMLFGGMFGFNMELLNAIDNEFIELNQRIENNGIPMPVLPIDFYEFNYDYSGKAK